MAASSKIRGADAATVMATQFLRSAPKRRFTRSVGWPTNFRPDTRSTTANARHEVLHQPGHQPTGQRLDPPGLVLLLGQQTWPLIVAGWPGEAVGAEHTQRPPGILEFPA